MTLLSRIDRFNKRHPWNHNDFYGGWVVRRVHAVGAHRVLDIGCGTGNLIDRLRTRGARVTGIEPDPDAARTARARFAGDGCVEIEQVRFERFRSAQQWDAITMVAVLHHLPLIETLCELDRYLSPGGRLVVIGCFRESTPADLATSLVAVAANVIMAVVKHPRATEHRPIHLTAPVSQPRETLAEIRSAAAEYLPGAGIRRRLFWRYSLVYDKP